MPKTYRTQTCPCGRQSKRLFYTEKGKRCGDCIKNEGLKKTGAPVYQSRARQLNAACDAIRSDLESRVELDEDSSDIEGLKEEMENWRDNMQGTGLENTPKYEEVEAAVDNLDTGLSELSSAVSNYNEKLQALESLKTEVGDEPNSEGEKEFEELESEVDDAASEVESALDTLESTEFPGMY